MVGTTGFEPATSRTPSVRATRLRYVPTGVKLAACQSTDTDDYKREHLQCTPTANSRYLHSTPLQAPNQHQGYHRRSRSVKKARSVSRRSNSILRLSSSPAFSGCPPCAL